VVAAAWRDYSLKLLMNPDEAVRAHSDLHSEHSMAIHFGLLDMAAESYEAPVNELAAARMAHGIEEAIFVTPHIG
jgi:hypothetical protein